MISQDLSCSYSKFHKCRCSIYEINPRSLQDLHRFKFSHYFVGTEYLYIWSWLYKV
jgi:hypothetical protein